ncbi:Pumilio y domain member 6 [Polyrhizophydium stewartii]|uniref:Pumilio y domain member 6 n=1 Tax=Polyrhizophydium stewartii TaxID=2732419 RepID=A0ABR4N8Y8_9FUNG
MVKKVAGGKTKDAVARKPPAAKKHGAAKPAAQPGKKARPAAATPRITPVEDEDDQDMPDAEADNDQTLEFGEDFGDADGWEDAGSDAGEEQDSGADGSEAGHAPKAPATEEQAQKKRQARAEQRAQTKERKMQRSHASIIADAKAIWEEMRVKRLTKHERRAHVDKMMALIGGKTKELIFKHDASRIVQCCLKYGTPKQRDQIAGELKGTFAQLSQSLYGRFIVSKILNYCSPEYRSAVISEFYGKVRKLIRHKDASLILDEAYSQFANAQQRAALMEEFYGPEFAVFKSLGDKRTLQSLLESQPEKKPSILRHLRQALDSVLQKGSFSLARTPILHRAIFEYLTYAEPKVSKDMIELLKDHLVHILHTRDGARVAQYCILHATPKDRKHIIKTFKGFVHGIAKEQYGHAVLLSCFECIDDTVLVAKSLITELLNPAVAAAGESGAGAAAAAAAAAGTQSVSELLRDRYGSRVVLFLLSGRNKRHQPMYIIQELQQTDETRAQTTKKDDAARREQLLEATAPMLSQAIVENLDELLRDRIGGVVITEVVQTAGIDGDAIRNAILALLPKSLDPSGIKTVGNKTTFSDAEDDDRGEVDDGEESGNKAKKSKSSESDGDDEDDDEEHEDTDEDEDDMDDEDKPEKPFNVVSKLKSERDAARQESQGLDMHSSLLVNRASTLTLKQLVGRAQPAAAAGKKDANSAADAETPAWKVSFATSVFELVEPVWPRWLMYCAEDPLKRTGTTLIFVAMLELENKALTDRIVKATKSSIDKAAQAALKSQIATAKQQAEKERAERDKELADAAKSKAAKNKRKRDAAHDAAPAQRTLAIEILAGHLKL